MMFQLFSRDPHKALLKSAQPFQKTGKARAIDVDDVSLSVWEAGGDGQHLVFVHGNSACKEVFHEQVPYFAARGYSVIALDLPGHGASGDAAHPESQYSISGYALIIKRLLEGMGVRHPLVAGWSLGGHIAIEMIGRGFPVAGALIVGTPPAGPGVEEMAQAFLPGPASEVTMSESVSEEALHRYVTDLYGSLETIPSLFYQVGVRTDGRARRMMGEHWLRGEEGCHQQTVAAGAKQPICVMHGMKDAFVSYDYLKELTWRNLWRNEIFTFDSAGHAPFVEAPERFNQLLDAFAGDVFGR